MRNKSLIETLEPRQLLSGAVTGMVVTESENGHGWTIVSDAGGMFATNAETGARITLPRVSPDGTVSLVGTENPDNIIVERVTGVPAPVDPSEIRQIYLMADNNNGMAIIGDANLDTHEMSQRRDREIGVLAQRQARLDELLADPTSQEWLVEMQRDTIKTSQDIIASMNDLIERIDAAPTTDFMRYRLAGSFDVLVSIPEGTTPTGKVIVDGKAGNDKITVSTNVPMKVSLTGGPGADVITSGKKTANLYGGSGNDRLISRSEKGGSLDGGSGADRYYSRSGEVNIAAKADGDRVVAGDRSIIVSKAGVFGSSPIGGNPYFLVDGIAGQIDLLS